jgi:RNA polymerase sigma-70 factor (ECF subfamily)
MSAAAALEQYRPALTGHCYRMLGSVVDAEDAVQEAMLRAWKGIDRFREQSSPKTWLYRIATNVCLDALSAADRRRVRPVELSRPGVVRDGMALPKRSREHWVEPIPDLVALPAPESCDPEEHAILRESIRLAFVAALQYLPPRQRAVLLLTQVLNWSAAETAESLGMSVAAVNSALQRARATLDARNPAVAPRALSAEQTRLVARYVAAFERYDVVALTALLHEEATLSMPPFELWLQGHASIAQWLLAFGRRVPRLAARAGGRVRRHAGLRAVPAGRGGAVGAPRARGRGRSRHEHDLLPRRRGRSSRASGCRRGSSLPRGRRGGVRRGAARPGAPALRGFRGNLRPDR